MYETTVAILKCDDLKLFLTVVLVWTASISAVSAETRPFEFRDMRHKDFCLPAMAMDIALILKGYEYVNQEGDIHYHRHPNGNTAFLIPKHDGNAGHLMCLIGAGYKSRKA